jgi:hypothetical protein
MEGKMWFQPLALRTLKKFFNLFERFESAGRNPLYSEKRQWSGQNRAFHISYKRHGV